MTYVLLVAAFLIVGRFTIPGHGLTGWPGIYEAFAHIGLGTLFAVAVYDKRLRALSIVVLIGTTALEIVMFLRR